MIQGPDCYDIAIIGGGLAGLSAAVAIGADSEARVVLIDKDVGHNNTTPITFSDVVQRFGLEDSVVNRYGGFSVHSSLGRQSFHYYSDFPLVSLDYRWACYILLTRAQQSLGFTWQRGYATGLAKDREGWMISVDSRQQISAPLLIDASGRAHFAARGLHLARPRMYSHCYGQFFTGCRVTNHELAEDVCLFLGGSERFGNGGGWCYPLGAGRISFGFASITDSSWYPLRLVRQRYQRALQELAPYADVLARGKPGPVERGSIPLGPVRRFVYDGLMLVGDAAGQATPWACRGSESALINGQTCGRVAAKAFKQGNLRAKVLREYETAWAQANLRSYQRGTMLTPLQWTHSEEVWDKITASYSRFTPEEALAHLRYNEPIHSLPILGRSIVYDRLGRIGQGIQDWVQQHLRILQKKTMARLMHKLMVVDQRDRLAEVWTLANIGEVLPGVVTPLTWSVFRANLLRQPLSKIDADSSPNEPIRLIKGRAYLRLDALLGSFCYLPGVDPEVVCQALGIDQKVHPSDDWRPRGNLLTRLSGGLFLTEILGLSPVLSLQLARLGIPPTDENLTEQGVSTSSAAPVRRIEELIDWNTHCLQLHLKCTRYAIGAYGLLTYMLRHWLPDAGVNATRLRTSQTRLEVKLLASQAELQTPKQGLTLWWLAEQARAHPNVAAVLEDEVDWTTAQSALQTTEEGRKFLEALAAFLTRHGARTVEEFELASPRWREDPTFVLTVLRNYLHADPAFNPSAALRQHQAFCDVATARSVQQMGPLKGRLFHRVLRAYKAYVPMRENMKYRLMEGYEALRHCFLQLGDCLCTAGALDSKEDIFFLTAGEALGAGRNGGGNFGEIRAKVNRRRAKRASQERPQPPEVILGDDPAWALDENSLETLRGIACSPGYVVGKARVIRDIAMASHLQPGEILVAPRTDPGWTPLFLTAKAVVTDIGGFLSHGATVAREYGIPAVVNTKRASELVQNGQVITVDGYHGVVYLHPRSLLEAKQRT